MTIAGGMVAVAEAASAADVMALARAVAARNRQVAAPVVRAVIPPPREPETRVPAKRARMAKPAGSDAPGWRRLRDPQARAVLRAVAIEFGLTPHDLRRGCGGEDMAARRLAIRRFAALTGASCAEITRRLGFSRKMVVRALGPAVTRAAGVVGGVARQADGSASAGGITALRGGGWQADVLALRQPMRFADLLQAAARHFGLSPDLLAGRAQAPEYLAARAVLAAVARRATRLSFPQLGRAMGGRHHTCIMHLARRAEPAGVVALLAHLKALQAAGAAGETQETPLTGPLPASGARETGGAA